MVKVKKQNASLIALSKGNYLIQSRNVNVPKFNFGEYGFTFPGACSLFGGEIEEGETPKEGFERELQEELPGIKFLDNLEYRAYDWAEQAENIINKADKIFNGNVHAFLGFNLNDYIPQCALGKERGNNTTYKEFLSKRKECFYVTQINPKILDEIEVKEGAKYMFLPHEAVRSLVMYPGDKLGLLDDIVLRVKSGEFILK